MLYVVIPSECDHLAKHIACYVCDLINNVWFELSHFGIGSSIVQPSAKFTLDVM